jgi:hypothetical protein
MGVLPPFARQVVDVEASQSGEPRSAEPPLLAAPAAAARPATLQRPPGPKGSGGNGSARGLLGRRTPGPRERRAAPSTALPRQARAPIRRHARHIRVERPLARRRSTRNVGWCTGGVAAPAAPDRRGGPSPAKAFRRLRAETLSLFSIRICSDLVPRIAATKLRPCRARHQERVPIRTGYPTHSAAQAVTVGFFIGGKHFAGVVWGLPC